MKLRMQRMLRQDAVLLLKTVVPPGSADQILQPTAPRAAPFAVVTSPTAPWIARAASAGIEKCMYFIPRVPSATINTAGLSPGRPGSREAYSPTLARAMGPAAPLLIALNVLQRRSGVNFFSPNRYRVAAAPRIMRMGPSP